MAIGTATAILGAAVLGGGASLAASSKNSKAISQATDGQLQATRESNALTERIYGENKNILTPFITGGTEAGSRINALLGLTNDNGQAASAFDAFRKSTGYDFRLGEGMKGLNASFAARGLGTSGAAAKAALNYGQNIGSAEFGNYLGYLGNQQGVGLGAGSALAGVGQNYANTISANNNQSASAIGNGAIAQANNNNALYGNLAGIAGNVAGSLSSYGGMQRNPYGIAGGNIY